MSSVLLVLAVVLDGFTACFAYGVNRIKIPLLSAVLISLIGTGMLMLSLGAAGLGRGLHTAQYLQGFELFCAVFDWALQRFRTRLRRILQRPATTAKR